LWIRYYGGLFGTENLYIVASERILQDDPCPQANCILGSEKFDDLQRSLFMSEEANKLLGKYETVIHVDTDEFLIADPHKYRDLAEYISTTELSHVTGYGLDVIEGSDEHSLDFSRPILGIQRSFAYPNSALNKTAMIRTPVRWGRGFHFSTLPPQFDDLFILHFKYADTAMQLRWNTTMSALELDRPGLLEYYKPDPAKIDAYKKSVFSRPLIEGEHSHVRNEFNADYMKNIEKNAQNGIYYGVNKHENVVIRLPSVFESKI
jgi:hypothetical protein